MAGERTRPAVSSSVSGAEYRVNSGRATVVVLQHAAETLVARDLAVSAGHFIARFDQPVVEPLVVSLFVIMDEEFTNGVPQSHFTEENHSVQTFVLHRTHEPFDMWTQIW
jgi:hypothetical protein